MPKTTEAPSIPTMLTLWSMPDTVLPPDEDAAGLPCERWRVMRDYEGVPAGYDLYYSREAYNRGIWETPWRGIGPTLDDYVPLSSYQMIAALGEREAAFREMPDERERLLETEEEEEPGASDADATGVLNGASVSRETRVFQAMEPVEDLGIERGDLVTVDSGTVILRRPLDRSAVLPWLHTMRAIDVREGSDAEA